jgi:hypothetical protein
LKFMDQSRLQKTIVDGMRHGFLEARDSLKNFSAQRAI